MGTLTRFSLGIGAAAALLAGCGGSGPAFSPLTAMRVVAKNSAGHRALSYAPLFSFDKTDGGWPTNDLLNVHGILYGTTSTGGVINYRSCQISAGCGTVFSITPSGVEKTLYKFKGSPDGDTPYASLVDVNGTLYGTTYYGGSGCYSWGCGTVFSITTAGKERVLYRFVGSGGDGAQPQGGLINVNGTLYGTTQKGGGAYQHYPLGRGTVFSVTTTGKEHIIYKFGARPDGFEPVAGLLDVSGTLYGTTFQGGSGSGCSGSAGCGTVFSVTTAGKERMLYSFAGSRGNDGANPSAGLTDVGGTLYGTTEAGGVPTHGSYSGAGTVFSVTTSGQERVLHSFAGSPDGDLPSAGLIYVHAKFYGTTCVGGAYNFGTVFSITISGNERIRNSFSVYSCPLGGVTPIRGTLYGTTSYGGVHGWGDVYALKL